MPYLGNTPDQQAFTPLVEYFSGNGSTTVFTLSRPVLTLADLEVVVENVPQAPGIAFTAAGTTLTFDGAPPAGTNNIYVYYTSPITTVVQPGQGTVGTLQIADGAVTTAKIADGAITTAKIAAGAVITADIADANVTMAKLNTQAQYTGFKNRILNGGMQIDQRNNGASVTPTDGQYLVDRFYARQTTSGKFSAQQNAGSVTPPVGFSNYLGVTSLSAYAVASSDIYQIAQNIEGLNVSDLAWGTANASPITLSFWVRSSLTGTFGGCISNGANNRSYPFSYTISSANTWTSISITIPGDTTGTWLTTNGIGIQVKFGIGVGSTFSGTAGSWVASGLNSVTGATSVVGTNGATFYITGVQLEKGSTATSFDYRPYGTELALCQRYYQQLVNNAAVWTGDGNAYRQQAGLLASMRTAPTGTISITSSQNFLNNGTYPFISTTTGNEYVFVFANNGSTGIVIWLTTVRLSAEL